MLEIVQIPVLPHNANYNFILHGAGQTAVIDPSLAEPVNEVLKEKGWKLDYIVNTHHHWDHTDGNLELKEQHGAKIIGYKEDAKRIPGIDIEVNEGDEIEICGETANVMVLPGHTVGHIAYYFKKLDKLFSGDVIFAMGCGRLFEGTPEQAFGSLQKIASLPPETEIYCAHEYTLQNAEFAKSVMPDNHDIQRRYDEVVKLRGHDKPTVPTTVAKEIKTNPFLLANNSEEFSSFRKQKDNF